MYHILPLSKQASFFGVAGAVVIMGRVAFSSLLILDMAT